MLMVELWCRDGEETADSRKKRRERMQVEQGGSGRRWDRLTPGAMSPGTGWVYGVRGGSGLGC